MIREIIMLVIITLHEKAVVVLLTHSLNEAAVSFTLESLSTFYILNAIPFKAVSELVRVAGSFCAGEGANPTSDWHLQLVQQLHPGLFPTNGQGIASIMEPSAAERRLYATTRRAVLRSAQGKCPGAPLPSVARVKLCVYQ
jgi:hypothetical protein